MKKYACIILAILMSQSTDILCQPVASVSMQCACAACPCPSNKNMCCGETCSCIIKNGICLCADTHTRDMSGVTTAPIAYGELLDKITILELKTRYIEDEDKLKNIWNELISLQRTLDDLLKEYPQHVEALDQLKQQLYEINNALWEIEDAIRDKEAEQDFGAEFIALARSVYRTNDARCAVKRAINMLLNSPLIEEKSYKAY